MVKAAQDTSTQLQQLRTGYQRAKWQKEQAVSDANQHKMNAQTLQKQRE